MGLCLAWVFTSQGHSFEGIVLNGNPYRTVQTGTVLTGTVLTETVPTETVLTGTVPYRAL